MITSKVSVVLPCFNIENRVQHLIEGVCSVLNQTHPPAELLVIDDGSSDNSGFLIDEHIRPLVEPLLQFRQIRLKENSGVSVARNRGIAEAKSEYIAFIDFDDLWFPQYLESIVRALNADATRQLILAKTIFWSKRNGLTKARVQEFPDDINEWSELALIDYCMRNNFPVAMGSAVACRKEVFSRKPELLFDEFLSRETAEDVHFGFKFLAANLKPYFLSKPVVVHRTFLTRSVSRSQGARLFKDELITYDYIMKTVCEALIERIANERFDSLASMLALQAEIRTKFLFKSNLLHRRLLALISQLISRPKLSKDLIQVLAGKYFGKTDLALNLAFNRGSSSPEICESVDRLIANLNKPKAAYLLDR